jgi:hypothetical protein
MKSFIRKVYLILQISDARIFFIDLIKLTIY